MRAVCYFLVCVCVCVQQVQWERFNGKCGLCVISWCVCVCVCVQQVQWEKFNGKCGLCGDPFPGPRDNEPGGKYANGIITRKYQEGQVIEVYVQLTANHKVGT